MSCKVSEARREWLCPYCKIHSGDNVHVVKFTGGDYVHVAKFKGGGGLCPRCKIHSGDFVRGGGGGGEFVI